MNIKKIDFKKHRMTILVLLIVYSIFGVLIAIASFPTVFWNVRPAWLNTVEVKDWVDQSEPLSQSQLNILGRIIIDDPYPQSMIIGYAGDALSIHMNHQEDSIVSILENIISSQADDWAKLDALHSLKKVSPRNEFRAVKIYRAQLLNDNHSEDRHSIINRSIDGLYKFDLIESRELIERFSKDVDSEIASHASIILELIDELHLDEKK